MRRRQFVVIGALAFLSYCAFSLFRSSSSFSRPQRPDGSHSTNTRPPNIVAEPVDWSPSPIPHGDPKPAPAGSHPIAHLIAEAGSDFDKLRARQSRTLKDAVTEYRRRYGIAPPPNFDKWWELAKDRDVQLVDEFDTIFELMTPFWGLKPATIRARAKEALGFDNALMGFSIRGGAITNTAGGQEWQKNATRDMLEPFLNFLPDMDLAFNVHDEPRVMVPHDDMARLVRTARDVNMAAARAVAQPKNEFTPNPKGLGDGTQFEPTKLTRFNFFAHQPTWTHSRMSCPADSPARALEEDDMVDDVGKFGLGELGFVYNSTAMSDICLSPSLRETYGFFDRPNAYNLVHDLFPIFSQSKISSYADMIYPSPWYWADKAPYNEEKDAKWADKLDRLYWRGSTTGGYSRNGGWRRQHRQRFVQKINSIDTAKILTNEGGSDAEPKWAVQTVPRGEYKDIMDVYFSDVGQCDAPDCEAQKQFFSVKERAARETAFQYKYVLDLDGNAFSGRFYAFLKSRSLVYKYALFREWHAEWVRPWAHYIPLSLQGDDWLEAVRFFGDGGLGKKEAERIAIQSKEWANKVLRNEDLEVWFFRLLLEYGRVIDDNRETIGYVG
ncbi:hypothetical protein B0H67DRAFT_494086 [Lasiosphaeris hirsuta]|uniref:Glycosyl transferase CAP10 domain-containing protein n=1 Tax=Lasiosphaeris hirsuta TaxID=260670 RepID=A0AA40DQ82_9PEZI|nr:hypothetical protein B0H67DRAFT_494086 [Lasiosphaeris hirsuta]